MEVDTVPRKADQPTGFAARLKTLREAAGLSQQQLADRTGRERSVIARWEQGAVSPSIDNLIAVVHACDFELPLVLVPRDTSRKERLEEGRRLSPERRVDRLLERTGPAAAGRA
jgi:transcriptional regulator with XRE-family HTH domain